MKSTTVTSTGGLDCPDEIRLGPLDDTAAGLQATAAMWRGAWLDGHEGSVPEQLLAVRGRNHFSTYLAEHRDQVTVATDCHGEPQGLVIIDPSRGEVVQLAVGARVRGSGCADRLMEAAESQLARHHRVAWLAVVPGNARAQRFYRRRGWTDCGPMTHQAPGEHAGDQPVSVPVRRYTKTLKTREAS